MRTSDGDRGDGRPIEEAWPDLANAPRSSRYQIYGLIGRGASGLVYRALDLTGHFPLALKSLKSATPEEIYHLKAEFRTLRDIYHPNLVQLFNLHVQDDHCYFTMELIDGQDFVSYARIPSARDDTQLDFEQLRPALRQLGEGLEALHRQGILHRDLKPTNVLVTAGGRTVLLDFGLSINTEAGADALSRSRVLAGTPSYMAPELFRAGQPTAASDWYGVGAILYEALTGRCPFPDAGPHFETFLAAKQAGAPDPSQLNGDVPDDLRDLTMALLEWDPSRRAGADEVARCTKQHAGESHVSEAAIVGRAGQHKFVGRVEELARLHGALEQSTTSEPMLALVSGEPGVGKTALIEQFISEVDDREDVLILRANCHAEEEVRYKAIDGLVDHLSHHLKSLDSKMLAQLTPASLPALTKVFPVLARVPFELPANYEEPSADPRINVNRAFVALRQILGRVASHRRTIIWIDDFQWADQASIDRLGELLGGLRDSEPRPGDASKPIALTVISYRAGEGRFEVADLLGQRRSMSAHTMIRLGPLSSEESRSLFSGVLDDGAAVPVDDVDDLSRQGAGLPLFIIELAGFVRERGPDSKADLGSNLNFDLILRQRLASLPEAQCKMLRLVALSPRPMPDDLLKLTIGPQLMGHETYSLCRQRLLRRRVADGWPAIETYHDRIRQAILAADTDEENRRGEHRLIAENLRVLPRRRYRGGQIKQVDLPMLAQHYESLLEHYRGAGDLARVSRYAIAAAKIASSRLAFDHAAGLLELALKHRRRGTKDWPLRLQYALALGNVGRATEAAEQYATVAQSIQLDSVAGGGKPDSLLLATQNVRAAEQFLYAGNLSAGVDLLREVFHELQLPFPLPGRRARTLSYYNRLPFLPVTFGLRRFTPLKRDHVIEERVRLRLDSLWIAAKSTLMLDYSVGDVISSRYLKEALQLREPSRALRAMGLEACVYANIGGDWMLRRSKALMQRAAHLAADGDAFDRAWIKVCETTIAWCEGRWDSVARPAEEALQALAQCAGTNFDVAVVQGFALSARAFLGDIKGITDELPSLLEDAAQRGDHYTRSVFQSGYLVYLHLAADKPDVALKKVDATLEQAPSDRFTSMHFHHFNAYLTAQLYAGDVWRAWSHVTANWPRIESAGFLRLGCIGAHLRELRARVAVAVGTTDRPVRPGEVSADQLRKLLKWTPERLLRLAERDAREIARRSLPHTSALAAVIRAGVAAARRQGARQRTELEVALEGFEHAGMSMHAEAVRLRLSRLEGRPTEHAEVIELMHRRGIRDPEQMSDVLVPGRSARDDLPAGPRVLS